MMEAIKTKPARSQRVSSVLGLSFDGGRLDAVVLRRPNGTVEVKKRFGVSLSLDPLTNDPELVGREIRKQLDDAGIRERRCVVCLPLKWALTLQVKLPQLEEADLESFLQIEAERGFPHAPETLMLAQSRFRVPNGEQYVTLVAVPRDHVSRMEAVLEAAKLRPVSFSLGITALQGADQPHSNDVLALVPGETNVGLLVVCGGGVAVLRTLEGAFETEGSEKRIQADLVARETRITLGQLPPEMRDAVRQVRILGHNEAADELAEQLRPRVEPLGIRVEQVRDYAHEEFGVRFPSGTAVAPNLSLAARYLAGRETGFEFLPPKISAWKQFTTKYSSGPLATAGMVAGAVFVIVLLAFLGQQIFIQHWQGKWNKMSKRVGDLNRMQNTVVKYRPWFDPSCRSLSVLKQLTEAFPPDGSVSAKNFEIREESETQKAGTKTVSTKVICSGTAISSEAFNRMFDQLKKARQVRELRVDSTKIGTGGVLDFSFNFKWVQQGAS